MKKFMYLFVAILAFSSCSSDDDDLEASVVGTWQLTSKTLDGTENATDCDKEQTITFTADNKFSSKNTTLNTNTMNGVTTTSCDETTPGIGTWEKIANGATVVTNLNTATNYILNGNTITLSFNISGAQVYTYTKK